MKYNAFDLVVPAWLHTKKILCEKVLSWKKIFFYAFLVFMSSSALGLNINFRGLLNGSSTGSYDPDSPMAKIFRELIASNIISPTNLLTTVIVVSILAIVFSFVWMYISCNFTYILNESVLLNKMDIKELWAKNNKKATSYFWLLFTVIIGIFVICILTAVGFGFMAGFSISPNIPNTTAGMSFCGMIIFMGIIIFLACFIGIFLCVIANCVVPLHLRMDETISVKQAFDIVFKEFKKDWKKAFLCLIALALIYGVFAFVFGLGSFAFNMTAVIGLVSISSSSEFLLLLGLAFTVYGVIVIFLNSPVAVFLSSYKLLVMSYLCPELAVLLPVQDERGKFIDTMSYFEHMEREQMNFDTNYNNENYETYPGM